MSNESKPADNMELLKQESAACGAECGCHATTGGAGKTRWIVGALVLVAAGVLVVRAIAKDDGTETTPASTGFAALVAPEQTPASAATVTSAVTNTITEIAALSELNAVAADSYGVLVFLPGKDASTIQAPIAQMQGAARSIEPQLRGGKISMFALKTGSRDYERLARQMAVPGVVAMVKGGGMSTTSGDITETKIVQALVAASSSGGCSGGGCGPVGCK